MITDTDIKLQQQLLFFIIIITVVLFLQKKTHIPLCAKHKIILANGKKWPKLYLVSLGGIQRSPLLRHVMTDRLYHRSDA